MRRAPLLVAVLVLSGCPESGPSKAPSQPVSVDVRPCFEGCPSSRPADAELDSCLVLEANGATLRTRLALDPDSPSTETTLRARRGSMISGQLFVLAPGQPAGACETLETDSVCIAETGCHHALFLTPVELAPDVPLLFADTNGGCTRTWGSPVQEDCNGEDEDCDGRIDEGFPGLGEACGRGIGGCRREGIVVCAGLDGVACDATAAAPAAADDACALTDADCDGRFAEDAGRPCNQDLAAPCRPGTQRCILGDTPRWSPCFSEFGHPVPTPSEEICDRRDNDCDGQTDEGVDLESDPSHCGACGHACGAADPSARYLCAAGTCVLDACNDGYTDTDGDPANGCECAAGAVDSVDALGTDADCDGVADEDSDGAVLYVAADAPDGGDGSAGAPLNSVAAALGAASAQGLSVALEIGNHDVKRGRTDEAIAGGPLTLPG